MKPALSPQTTGLLPSRPSRASTSARTPGSVTTVRMISTRFWTGAGLKKCTPMTRPGWALAVEISVTESDEVFVASTVSTGTMSVEPAEDLLLHLQGLDHGLDDEVRLRQVLHLGRERDPAEQLGLLRLAELAPRHGPARGVLQVLAAALDALLVDLHADHVEAVAGEHLRDAGPHRAEADHADGGEVAGRLVCCRGHAHGGHRLTRPRSRAVSNFTRGPVARPGAPGRFHPRETGRGAVPGGLRRTADRPPADGHPGPDGQGGRLGARPLRRRVLQAAELDVAAVHRARGTSPRTGQVEWVVTSRTDDTLRILIEEIQPRLPPRPRRRPRPAEGRRREAPPGSCSPSIPRRWPRGSPWYAGSTPRRSGRST